MNKKIFASVMLLSATLIWGFSYSVQTVLSDSVGTYTIVFLKAIGAIILYPILKIMKKEINRDAIIGGILIGTVAFLGCAFQQRGLELSTVSKASFITALYIVIVPIIEIVFGKKLKNKMLIAIVCALIGLYLLCFSTNMTFSLGDILLLICSFCFAIQIILIDRYSVKCDPLSLTFTSQMTISVLAGVMVIVVEKPDYSGFINVIWPILYLILLSGMYAQSIQICFQKDVGPSLGSLIMSFESVFGAIGGWLFLNQVLSIREIIGCILVFIAILIAE